MSCKLSESIWGFWIALKICYLPPPLPPQIIEPENYCSVCLLKFWHWRRKDFEEAFFTSGFHFLFLVEWCVFPKINNFNTNFGKGISIFRWTTLQGISFLCSIWLLDCKKHSRFGLSYVTLGKTELLLSGWFTNFSSQSTLGYFPGMDSIPKEEYITFIS